ncbi:unnamed protein product [[Candida] boidinii]|nr:unnamed protein product [[Candida] boidinii]
MSVEYSKYNKGELLHDKYLKIHDISEGSFGIVSLAKDVTNSNKLVAVKYITQLPNDQSDSEQEEENEDEDATKYNKRHEDTDDDIAEDNGDDTENKKLEFFKESVNIHTLQNYMTRLMNLLLWNTAQEVTSMMPFVQIWFQSLQKMSLILSCN